jgi:hypothetical protein
MPLSPEKVAVSFPLSKSQSRSVRSSEPETARRPSGVTPSGVDVFRMALERPNQRTTKTELGWLENGQRTVEKGLGLLVLALGSVKLCDVIEAGGHVGMLQAQALFPLCANVANIAS